MTTLFRDALMEADKVRMELGYNMFQPVNVLDICQKLGLTVRFLDINMEGMYISQESSKHPTILLSNQRPLPRRFFTCGHELGHHRFSHGTKIDNIAGEDNLSDNEEERLVNMFSGALLMPVAGIQAHFVKQKLQPSIATPIQFYSVSSTFGVGYQTLIKHCRMNKVITEAKEKELLKVSPSKILKQLMGESTKPTHFKIFSTDSITPTIDLEVGNYLVLSDDLIVEGEHLKKVKKISLGHVYLVIKPGIVRTSNTTGSSSSFVRIQNRKYVGLAENRHLEIQMETVS